VQIFNCNKKANKKFIEITNADGFNVGDISMVVCWIIFINLTTITSKCVALCYFLFISDAVLNRGAVNGSIKGPKCGLQGYLQHYSC